MQKQSFKKRLWIVAVLLSAVALVTGVYLTYSAYTAGSFLKAVAATGASQALFASDVLEPPSAAGGVVEKPVVADSADGTCSFTFKIYNCQLDDRNVVNRRDVNVNLSVAATGAGEKNGYVDGKLKGWTISPDETTQANADNVIAFPGYRPTVKSYTITFNKDYLNQADLAFTIRADVIQNSSPGTNLSFLAARVVPSERAQVTAAAVTGIWVDGAKDVSGYDAYNYRVTVTGKASLVKLTWGSNVDLDPYFCDNHIATKDSTAEPSISTERGGSSVTFYMEPGSEIINFFCADGHDAPSDWGAMGVSCTSAN